MATHTVCRLCGCSHCVYAHRMASTSAPAAGTTTLVRPAELSTFHRNARIGDVDAIAGSLKANGQFKPIVVNIGTHTSRPNEVLAGNHTLKAFRDLAEQNPFDERWTYISVHWVDVDDDMATRIVLVDNRTFEQGEFDADTLVALLNTVGTTGTAYSDADLDALEATLDRPPVEGSEDNDNGDDPPLSEPDPPPLGPASEPAVSYTITFDDEAQQDAWFAFVKWLKDQYPDPDLTLAERLVSHLQDTAKERA